MTRAGAAPVRGVRRARPVDRRRPADRRAADFRCPRRVRRRGAADARGGTGQLPRVRRRASRRERAAQLVGHRARRRAHGGRMRAAGAGDRAGRGARRRGVPVRLPQRPRHHAADRREATSRPRRCCGNACWWRAGPASAGCVAGDLRLGVHRRVAGAASSWPRGCSAPRTQTCAAPRPTAASSGPSRSSS